MDEFEKLEQVRKMKTFLTQYKETVWFYPELPDRARNRVELVLAMDSVPDSVLRSYRVFQDHCTATKRDPFTNEALYFFTMLPG